MKDINLKKQEMENTVTIDTMNFDSDAIDFMDKEARKNLIFGLFKKQFLHNKLNVPFYKNLYKDVDPQIIQTFEDCVSKVPTLNKTDVRNLASPYDLLDETTRANLNKIYLYRGTGGTTGEPTSMFYTYNDWKAILGAKTRSLKELKSLDTPIIAFNGYNQGHISGPVFDDAIRKLGGISIARNFGNTDEKAIIQLKRHNCNLLIAPPVSTHKGGSVESLLEADAKLGVNYINGDNIHTVLVSSTNLTKELYKELKSLGIKYIYNFYGSTDALPTAVSCQENPFDLHILYGHIHLFVVNEKNQHVDSNEKGIVISGRIASYGNFNNVTVNQGTQLLNFHVGDEVTFIDEPCKCGRTTPRIKDIRRVSFVQDKMENGCEQW